MRTLFKQGVDLLQVIEKKHHVNPLYISGSEPRLGMRNNADCEHLVNARVEAVFVTEDDDLLSTNWVLPYNNGSLTAVLVPSEADEKRAQGFFNQVRDYLTMVLFGPWDPETLQSTGKGRVQSVMSRENVSAEEALTSIFRPFEAIGVIDDAEEVALKWLNAHFEDGDIEGDIRPNSGQDGRSYMLTVALGELVRAESYWPIGNGEFQDTPGAFGLDRTFRIIAGKIGEVTSHTITRNDEEFETADVEMKVEPRKIGGVLVENAPELYPLQGCDQAYETVLKHKALQRAAFQRRQREMDPSYEEAILTYARLSGVDVLVDALYEQVNTDLPIERWREGSRTRSQS